MTSSPAPTPAAISARCSAVVPLETAHAWGAPTTPANSRSKASTSGPCVTQPERMARRAASTSRSSMTGLATGIIELGSDTGSPDRVGVRVEPSDQAGEAFFEADPGLEAQELAGLADVGEAATDLDRLAFGGQGNVLGLELEPMVARRARQS